MIKPNELPHVSLTNRILCTNIMRNDNEELVENYELEIKNSGRVDGILYWYNINYIEDVLFDTYQSTHYNSACFLVSNDEHVEINNTFKISIKQHKGLLKIF